MQSVEGLMVENSLVRVWVISWNLPDGSVEMNQAIERSGGIEGGGQMNLKSLAKTISQMPGCFWCSR